MRHLTCNAFLASASFFAPLLSFATALAQPSPAPLPTPGPTAYPAPVLRPASVLDEPPKPPPIHVEYASYGVAVTADVLADAGATCPQLDGISVPCILGSGGGVAIRGGYRSPGPWYIGGAYQFSKTDSSNLYRLAILQQLRAEMRYMLDMGYRTRPYATWGLGGVVYGNEWGVETGGGTLFGGVGFEMELSRVALLGMAVVYQPMILAPFVDTAEYSRELGLAQFVRIEVQLEIRSELTRR